MAKALLGYVAADNPHQTREIAVLRRRVTDLSAEVLRLKAENDALHAALTENLSPADLLEPAAHWLPARPSAVASTSASTSPARRAGSPPRGVGATT